MYSPIGLSGLEIMVMAGVYAGAFMSVASCIGATAAWLLCRERAPAPQVAAHPAVTRAPEYAPA